MPCLYISTNVTLEGVDTGLIFSEATTAVSRIIGKPENYVMVLLKGSVELTFGGNKEAAAFAEIVSMGGIDSKVKKQLISNISNILWNNLSIHPSRFFLNVIDTTLARTISKL